MTDLRLKARAKVNLTLSVRGVRADGYHFLHSYAASVDLADEVTLRPAPPGTLTVTVSGPEGVPTGTDNLAWRAADALRRRYAGRLLGAEITVEKAIPAGAGMGGASADAAAVLVGLNRLWRLGMGAEELAALGLELGADVPFCLTGGLALMEGIGERLTPLTPPASLDLVIVTPPEDLITGDVFRRYDALDRDAGGGRVVDPEAFLEAWTAGPERLAPLLTNDLEEAAASLCPGVLRAKDALLAAGAAAAVMSGSGPTVVGVPASGDSAEELCARVRAAGHGARVVGLRPAGVEEG